MIKFILLLAAALQLPTFAGASNSDFQVELIDSMIRVEGVDGTLKTYGVSGKSTRLDRIEGRWPGGGFYLLTTDENAGFGSYSGDVTRLFQVQDGRLHWIDEVHLLNSLKTHCAMRIGMGIGSEWRAGRESLANWLVLRFKARPGW